MLRLCPSSQKTAAEAINGCWHLLQALEAFVVLEEDKVRTALALPSALLPCCPLPCWPALGG